MSTHKLLKAINKFNGNLCIAGSTDHGDIVIECDYHNRIVSYAYSSKLITDVCLNDDESYLVVFGDNYIGKYQNGILEEECYDAGISNVNKIEKSTESEYYILNQVTNQLIKLSGITLCDVENSSSSIDISSSSSSSGGSIVSWIYDLPDYALRYEGDIVLRESDRSIIYYNNTNIHLIRDDLTSAVLINSLALSGSGRISVAISGEFNPIYADIRARTVSAGDLDYSSSSSSSSLEYSSSSSTSSLEYSSSSSSSNSSSSFSSSSSSSFSSSSSSSFSSSSSSSSSSSLYDCPECILDYSCVTVPNMTTNTTPVPYITSAPGGGDAFLAFQHDLKNGFGIDGGDWLKVDMSAGNEKIINHYEINTTKPTDHPTWLWNTPKSWELQASNDDSIWTILHTVDYIPITEGAYCFTYIGNTTPYRYYRIVLVDSYHQSSPSVWAGFNQILLVETLT